MGAVVYFFAQAGRIKVGFSKDFEERLRKYSRSSGPIRVIGTIPGDKRHERIILQMFAEFNEHSEWFVDCSDLRDKIKDILEGRTKIEPQPDSWFSNAARLQFPKDAGLHLHLATGFPESSCYSYVRGSREPSTSFIRALLRSNQGEPFFLALMGGCEAAWWVDLQRQRRNAERVKNAQFE